MVFSTVLRIHLIFETDPEPGSAPENMELDPNPNPPNKQKLEFSLSCGFENGCRLGVG